MTKRSLVFILLFAFPACGDDATQMRPDAASDALRPQDVGANRGEQDAGSVDAHGGRDVGVGADTGTDANVVDAGRVDAGVDAGMVDAGPASPWGPPDLECAGGGNWSACNYDCPGATSPVDATCTGLPPFHPVDGPLHDEVLPVGGAGDGTTWYVDGSAPTNGSGTMASPFNSIAAGLAQLHASAPGDDLVLFPGQYYEPFEVDELTGTPGNPTVIRGMHPATSDPSMQTVIYGVDRRTVVDYLTQHPADGSFGSRPEAIAYAHDSTRIRMGALRLHDTPGRGFYGAFLRGFTLFDVHTDNTGTSGILIEAAEDIHVLFNEVRRAVQVWGNECMTLADFDRFTIVGNLVHDRQARSPDGRNIGMVSGQSHYILARAIGSDRHHVNARLSPDGWRNNDGCRNADFDAAAGEIRLSAECNRGGEGFDLKRGSQYGVVAFNRVDRIQGKFAFYFDATGFYENPGLRGPAGTIVDQQQIEVHHNMVTRSGESTTMTLSTEAGSSTRGRLRDMEVHNNIFVGGSTAISVGNHGGDCTPADGLYEMDGVTRSSCNPGDTLERMGGLMRGYECRGGRWQVREECFDGAGMPESSLCPERYACRASGRCECIASVAVSETTPRFDFDRGMSNIVVRNNIFAHYGRGLVLANPHADNVTFANNVLDAARNNAIIFPRNEDVLGIDDAVIRGAYSLSGNVATLADDDVSAVDARANVFENVEACDVRAPAGSSLGVGLELVRHGPLNLANYLPAQVRTLLAGDCPN